MDTEWEKTLIAEEFEDDHTITPGQRIRTEIDQTEKALETLELDQDLDAQDKKRKVTHASSDEETIAMQVGNFVNSFIPLDWMSNREEKVKNEPKKVKIDDV